MDEELLFFFIILTCLFLYRLILSIRLLKRKQNMIDEKFYVYFFVCSIAMILCFIFKSIILGIIIVVLSPVIVSVYFAIIPNRTYWIINGYEITDATYNNEFMKLDNRYENLSTLISIIQFMHKKQEKKTKLVIREKDFKKKEILLDIVKRVLKENVKKSNKNEIFTLIFSIFGILLMTLGTIILLFT